MNTKEITKSIQNEEYYYSQSYFEGLSTGWSEVSYPIISKLVKSCLKKCNPKTILDLGCGNGSYFDIFKTYSKYIYGVDASKESVSICNNKDYHSVTLANATLLPFPDNYFDFIFTSEVLEHVEEYIVMLNEVNRVLKPKGILLLTTTCYSTSIFQLPYKGNILKYLNEIYCYSLGYISEEKRKYFIRKWCFESLGGHYHGFRPKLLKKDLKKINMTILEAKSLYIVPPFKYHPKRLAKSAISRKKKRPIRKRIVMLLISLIIYIWTPFFRLFGFFANNVYVLAQSE